MTEGQQQSERKVYRMLVRAAVMSGLDPVALIKRQEAERKMFRLSLDTIRNEFTRDKVREADILIFPGNNTPGNINLIN